MESSPIKKDSQKLKQNKLSLGEKLFSQVSANVISNAIALFVIVLLI